jgi:hypothetical protein
VNGSGSPRYTFPVYEENPCLSSDGAAAERRGSTPKSHGRRKPDLRDCDIVEVDDDGNEIIDKVTEKSVKIETSTRLPPLEENEYYTPPQKVREKKRGVKNDEYLRGKIRELRTHIKNVRVSARYSEEKAATMAHRVGELEKSIEKLQGQFSNIDLSDSKYYGGVAIPPPPGLYDGPAQRTGGGNSTRRMDPRHGRNAGPYLRPGTSWRVNMRDGSRFVVCSRCRQSLTLDGDCSTRNCIGLPPQQM